MQYELSRRRFLIDVRNLATAGIVHYAESRSPLRFASAQNQVIYSATGNLTVMGPDWWPQIMANKFGVDAWSMPRRLLGNETSNTICGFQQNFRVADTFPGQVRSLQEAITHGAVTAIQAGIAVPEFAGIVRDAFIAKVDSRFNQTDTYGDVVRLAQQLVNNQGVANRMQSALSPHFRRLEDLSNQAVGAVVEISTPQASTEALVVTTGAAHHLVHQFSTGSLGDTNEYALGRVGEFWSWSIGGFLTCNDGVSQVSTSATGTITYRGKRLAV